MSNHDIDRQAIISRALRHGFTLREQPGGEMDLNDYVYAFAREVFEAGRLAGASESGRPTSPCQGHARQQEADELRARVAELEALCGELYQVAGALDAPIVVLDALHAAAGGDPLSGVSLIGLDIANEIDRAKRAAQKPIGRIFFPKHRKAPDVHWADNAPILEGAAIYAAPPVTAQAEGYVTALRYIAWEAAGYMECVHAAKRAIGETGALPPPPKIQPTEAGG